MSEKIILTQTLIGEFTNCRRKFYFDFVEKIRRKRFSPPLEFGSTVHKCLQQFYSLGLNAEQLGNMFENEFNRVIGKFDYETVSEDDLEEIERLKVIGKKLMIKYAETYKEEDFKMISLESKFIVPLLLEENIFFSGRRDGLARMKGDGSLWLVEHKTKKAFGPSDRKVLATDLQTGSYIWELVEHEHLDVIGCLYNVIKKVDPDKQKKDNTPFFRDKIYWGKEEIKNAKQHLLDISTEIKSCLRTGRFYRNPDQHCSYCDYFEICINNDNERMKELHFDRREEVSPELNDKEGGEQIV